MIESFISEIKSFDMTSTLGLLMYWLPLALCIVGYSFKTWKEYQSEILDREKTDYYLPTLKIGTIVGRVILSFVPFANKIFSNKAFKYDGVFNGKLFIDLLKDLSKVKWVILDCKLSTGLLKYSPKVKCVILFGKLSTGLLK